MAAAAGKRERAAVQKVREAAARAQSANNLKQIGLACRNFHTTYKCFPTSGLAADTIPAMIPANSSQQSAHYQLLPYLEQTALYQNPPTTFSNTAPVIIKAYLDPGRGRKGHIAGKPVTDYAFNAMVIRPNTTSSEDGGMSTDNINDGASNTILGGQKSIHTSVYNVTAKDRAEWDIFEGGATTNRSWMDSSYADPRSNVALRGKCLAASTASGTAPSVYAALPYLVPDYLATPVAGAAAKDQGEDQFGGPYTGGTLLVFCDGSVHLLSYAWGAGTHTTSTGPASPVNEGGAPYPGTSVTTESVLRAALSPSDGDQATFE
jgi:Protein of unknown function (DUF1559)